MKKAKMLMTMEYSSRGQKTRSRNQGAFASSRFAEREPAVDCSPFESSGTEGAGGCSVSVTAPLGQGGMPPPRTAVFWPCPNGAKEAAFSADCLASQGSVEAR